MEYQELQECFNTLIEKHGILLDINRDLKILPDWPIVAVDVEHDEQGNLVGIGICYEHSCCYWTKLSPELKTLLGKKQLICHNGRSDFDILRSWGIDVKDSQLYWDTQLFAHILDSSRHEYGLKKLAKEDLGIVYPGYDDIVGKRTKKQSKPRKTLDQWPLDLVAQYNSLDTFCTYRLYELQNKQIK